MNLKLLHLLWIAEMFAVTRASIYRSTMISLRNISNSETQKVTNPSFEPEIPEHCRDQGVCEDVPNYPQEYIDELLQRNSTVSNALNYVMRGFGTPAGCKDNLKNPDNIELCSSKIKLILAKAGRDSRGRWRFLVGEHWLCVEICEKVGAACTEKVLHIFNNYKATCEQKHIRKHSIGLDEYGSMTFMDVNVSSACCCHVTQVY